MKIPVRSRDSAPRFNITPLIDICFNLIVFFALASVSVRKEAAGHIALPQAGRVEPSEESIPRRMVVTVNADRRMFVAGSEISPAELERRLVDRCEPDPSGVELRIRADQSVPFADIKPMIVACARLGITNLKFAVHTTNTPGG